MSKEADLGIGRCWCGEVHIDGRISDTKFVSGDLWGSTGRRCLDIKNIPTCLDAISLVVVTRPYTHPQHSPCQNRELG